MKFKFLFFFYVFVVSISYSQGKLPNTPLKNLDGEIKNIQDYVADGITVISFWATWCIPCINELEAIHEDYDAWEAEGIKLIGVAVDNQKTVAKVRPMVYGKDWEFEVLFDTNQDLKRALNINAIPYLIALKNGKIIFQKSGYTPGEEIELLEQLLQLKD